MKNFSQTNFSFYVFTESFTKKKTCRGFERHELAQQGADKADAYVFFFNVKIVWIHKTSTKFKIAICRRWIMLSRSHFAHMPRFPVCFHRGVCFCVSRHAGRRPRWPPPRWAVKLEEDVFKPDVKRRTQQRRFKEEKATERGNGQKWWEKERASSRAASQNESEESKNGENPEERSLDPEPVGVPWQPSHFILFLKKKKLFKQKDNSWSE